MGLLWLIMLFDIIIWKKINWFITSRFMLLRRGDEENLHSGWLPVKVDFLLWSQKKNDLFAM